MVWSLIKCQGILSLSFKFICPQLKQFSKYDKLQTHSCYETKIPPCESSQINSIRMLFWSFHFQFLVLFVKNRTWRCSQSFRSRFFYEVWNNSPYIFAIVSIKWTLFGQWLFFNNISRMKVQRRWATKEAIYDESRRLPGVSHPGQTFLGKRRYFSGILA